MNPTRRIMLAGMKGMILLLVLALASCAPAPVPATRTSPEIPQATKQQVLVAYGKLPLIFEANQGQTDPQVKFLSRGSGYTLFLTPTEAVLTLTKADAQAKRRFSGESSLAEPEKQAATVLRMKLLGANPTPRVTGVEELRGRSNYFIGNDPAKWRANVPTYANVEYRDVYPGVNLVYYGNQRQLEFDFIVAPGADPQRIRLGVEGADRLDLDAEGDLVVHTGGAQVRLQQPHVYQMANGVRQEIESRYVLNDHHQVEVWVAAYDTHKPLVIDPTLAYSTYLGGTGFDEGFGIAVDSLGQAYVTGVSASLDFPMTAGAFQPRFAGGSLDAFVTKLNPTGVALAYSTYLGGTGDEEGFGIAVDATGNAYVTGLTNSNLDFPTTAGAFQPSSPGGFSDAFVTKLNPTGAALAYSTYLGGTGDENGFGIAVDATGNAYVTGITFSPDFPTTARAFQPSSPGGDAFVTKLNPSGAALVYSTYLGGTGSDLGFGIAVDSFGNAYVTGQTFSSDFPTTEGAFQTTFGGGGGFDAFLTKVNPAGAALVYSTYLGGTSDDFGLGIAVDSFGNAYVTGFTGSLDFPTLGAFQTTSGDGADAFVAKFSFATTNTRVGTNVVVQPVDATSGATPVTVTFANVTAAGDTTLTTSAAGPQPPAGFKLGTPPTYYDLTTTASFSGDVTVCINYNTITFNNVASHKLFHFVDPNWVDATVSLHTATQIICGRVTSLSPFAIFEPADQPFAAFHARIEIEHERHKREFEVKGTFTLGAGSNGINPLTEDVTLEVGAFTATIPAGSFRRHGQGTFKFEGVAGGARLEVKIQARGGNRFEFKAEGKGAQVGTATPVTVRLAIGDDAGSTVARVKADDD